MDTFKKFTSIILKPFGGLSVLYGLFTFFRDEFLPLDIAEKLRLGGIFSTMAWYWWVIIGLAIWIFVVAWEAAKRRSESKISSDGGAPSVTSTSGDGGKSLSVGGNIKGKVYFGDQNKRETQRREANFRIEPVRELSEHLIGIRVFNDEDVDFTERTAELMGLAPMQTSFNNLIDMLPHENRILDWFEKETKIESGGHGLIKILSVELDGIHFYNRGGAFSLMHNIDETTWKVGVVIRGKLYGGSIIPKQCCITFFIRKDILDNNRVWWAIGQPTLNEGDCNWPKTISATEYLAVERKSKDWEKVTFSPKFSSNTSRAGQGITVLHGKDEYLMNCEAKLIRAKMIAGKPPDYHFAEDHLPATLPWFINNKWVWEKINIRPNDPTMLSVATYDLTSNLAYFCTDVKTNQQWIRIFEGIYLAEIWIYADYKGKPLKPKKLTCKISYNGKSQLSIGDIKEKDEIKKSPSQKKTS